MAGLMSMDEMLAQQEAERQRFLAEERARLGLMAPTPLAAPGGEQAPVPTQPMFPESEPAAAAAPAPMAPIPMAEPPALPPTRPVSELASQQPSQDTSPLAGMSRGQQIATRIAAFGYGLAGQGPQFMQAIQQWHAQANERQGTQLAMQGMAKIGKLISAGKLEEADAIMDQLSAHPVASKILLNALPKLQAKIEAGRQRTASMTIMTALASGKSFESLMGDPEMQSQWAALSPEQQKGLEARFTPKEHVIGDQIVKTWPMSNRPPEVMKIPGGMPKIQDNMAVIPDPSSPAGVKAVPISGLTPKTEGAIKSLTDMERKAAGSLGIDEGALIQGLNSPDPAVRAKAVATRQQLAQKGEAMKPLSPEDSKHAIALGIKGVQTYDQLSQAQADRIINRQTQEGVKKQAAALVATKSAMAEMPWVVANPGSGREVFNMETGRKDASLTANDIAKGKGVAVSTEEADRIIQSDSIVGNLKRMAAAVRKVQVEGGPAMTLTNAGVRAVQLGLANNADLQLLMGLGQMEAVRIAKIMNGGRPSEPDAAAIRAMFSNLREPVSTSLMKLQVVIDSMESTRDAILGRPVKADKDTLLAPYQVGGPTSLSSGNTFVMPKVK